MLLVKKPNYKAELNDGQYQGTFSLYWKNCSGYETNPIVELNASSSYLSRLFDAQFERPSTIMSKAVYDAHAESTGKGQILRNLAFRFMVNYPYASFMDEEIGADMGYGELEKMLADLKMGERHAPGIQKDLFRSLNYFRREINNKGERILSEKRDSRNRENVNKAYEQYRKAGLLVNILVVSNRGLAYDIIRKKRIREERESFGEYLSDALEAIGKSVLSFDVSRGFKFSTYACDGIIKRLSRKGLRERRRDYVEFDEKFFEESVNHCGDNLPPALSDLLEERMKFLSEKEQMVIHERFFVDRKKTLEEVGLVIGFTKERVRQIQNNALRKLREHMERNGYRRDPRFIKEKKKKRG